MFLIPLSVLLVLSAPAAQHAELAQIQSVYLFPMANGLDQFLASRITSLALFQVVTDPKKADAVFTDRLGEAFEARLDELYPAPVPAEPAPAAKKGEKDAEAQEETATEPKQKEQKPAQFSSWSRGRGNIFIVNTRTRAVIWSAYERPKDTSPDELNRTAERIASRLKREFKGK